MLRRFPTVLLVALLTILPACAAATPVTEPVREGGQTLNEFQQRLAHTREHLPHIIELGQMTADNRIAHPESLLNVPYHPQQSFAEDILNRSGGVANLLPTVERPSHATEHDVLIFSLRSWEDDWETAEPIIANAREQGWDVVLFASAAGAPEDLEYDVLIDNGAPDGTEAHAPMNAIVNVMNAWVWACEHTAALTRHDKHPGILQSATVEGAEEHNRTVQPHDRRRLLYDLPDDAEPIAAGELAREYLREVDELVNHLSSDEAQEQIAAAAEAVANQLNSGGKVGVATATHILMFEIFENNQTPWEPFNVVWRAAEAFPANLDEDDLVVWFSFIGLSSPYEDYGRFMRETGADMVTSYKTDEDDPSNNAHGEALAHIEQRWAFGDAVVDIPFPPGSMAPVSGIEQGLIYRMLDEAAASRLEEQ